MMMTNFYSRSGKLRSYHAKAYGVYNKHGN
jgi:hypothetical protein